MQKHFYITAEMLGDGGKWEAQSKYTTFFVPLE